MVIALAEVALLWICPCTTKQTGFPERGMTENCMGFDEHMSHHHQPFLIQPGGHLGFLFEYSVSENCLRTRNIVVLFFLCFKYVLKIIFICIILFLLNFCACIFIF